MCVKRTHTGQDMSLPLTEHTCCLACESYRNKNLWNRSPLSHLPLWRTAVWIKITLTPLLTVPLPPPVFTIACDQTTLTMLVDIVATLTVVSFAVL